MSPSTSLTQQLQELIDSSAHKESECREFLKHAFGLLVQPDFLEGPLSFEIERILNVGRSDYIVLAKVSHNGDHCNRAYFWELKSPQCFIFEKDTENRLKKSEELIDAINKLVHYYHENKNNQIFHQQYDIQPSNVCLGGIIIGSERKKVNGDYSDFRKTGLYRTMLSVWEIQHGERIRLRTWDEIKDFIKLEEIRNY